MINRKSNYGLQEEGRLWICAQLFRRGITKMTDLSGLAFIKIDNEDDAYSTFLKLFDKSQLVKIQGLRCHKQCSPVSIGNRIKKYNFGFAPAEGVYDLEWKDHKLALQIHRGDVYLTSECRMIDHLKEITVYGETLQVVTEFVNQIYSLGNTELDAQNIVIYENNGGYWNKSKEKRPRKLESVVFEKQFVAGIIADIQEFVDSEEWYTSMGIPYKRSYLFYGPPGTGKSSLAQAVAAEIMFSICFVNCSDRINDFNFNKLLNTAPKKSIILVEDVDSIFSERKNADNNNQLTFSGFLNAIDGVRSQEGRIIIMTTNYKERLDPALLRPGRVDEMYQIGLASRFQIERLCYRFFKDEQLAKEFSQALPCGKFSMSMIQGFMLRHRKNPKRIMEKIDDLLQSDENVKIQQYLTEVGCQQVVNEFKMNEIYTLASARSLPKSDLEKITDNLSPLLKGRLIETLRMDRKLYLKGQNELEQYIEGLTNSEHLQRELRFFCSQRKCNSIFQVKDKLRELTDKTDKEIDETAVVN